MLRTESLRRDTELVTLFLGLEPVVVAETAAVHKLSTLLPLYVVVPGQVVAVTRTLDLRQETGVWNDTGRLLTKSLL